MVLLSPWISAVLEKKKTNKVITNNIVDTVIWSIRNLVIEKLNYWINSEVSCTWFQDLDWILTDKDISCREFLKFLWISRERWVERFRHHFRGLTLELSGLSIDTLWDKENIELKDELQKITTLYTLMKLVFDTEDEEGNYYKSWKDHFWEFSSKLDIFLRKNNDELNWKSFWEIVDEIVKYLLTYMKNNSKGNKLSQRAIKEIFWFDDIEKIDISKIQEIQEIQKYPEINDDSKITYSNVRKAEELRNLVYDSIFRKDVETGGIERKDVERKMKKLNLAYGLVKLKFQWVNRKSWERYFEHLKQVTEIWLREGLTTSFEEVLISMLHDIIEDADISFETLRELFWEKVALWVQLISKDSFTEFIDDYRDNITLDKIKKSWILTKPLWTKSP